jgi:hypothetical protein
MALDHNAGQKRSVGLSRNLFAQSAAPHQESAPSPEPAPVSRDPRPSDRKPALEQPQFQQGRTKKISFLTDPKLEERFRKARLRAGFDKLEDAYNEAIKTFCDLVDAGKIDRF